MSTSFSSFGKPGSIHRSLEEILKLQYGEQRTPPGKQGCFPTLGMWQLGHKMQSHKYFAQLSLSIRKTKNNEIELMWCLWQVRISIPFSTKTNSFHFSSHIHRLASLLFKPVWDGEFMTSLGSLFQWSAIPTVKNSYFISRLTTTSFALQSLDLFLSSSALLKSPVHSKYSLTSVLTEHD